MAIDSKKSYIITELMFRGWVRCKRKAWLDKYGDKKYRVWSAHKSLQIDHQHQSFLELISKPPSKGIQGCQRGSSFISGLKLQGETPFGQKIKAYPSLLQKIEGKSQWGKFLNKHECNQLKYFT